MKIIKRTIILSVLAIIVVVSSSMLIRHSQNEINWISLFNGKDLNDWTVRAEFLVLGDSIIHHIIEGDTVLTYRKPQIGGDNPPSKNEGQPLKSGFISLQSESHPIEFRKVDLLDLEPYMHDQAKLQEILAKVAKEG